MEFRDCPATVNERSAFMSPVDQKVEVPSREGVRLRRQLLHFSTTKCHALRQDTSWSDGAAAIRLAADATAF